MDSPINFFSYFLATGRHYILNVVSTSRLTMPVLTWGLLLTWKYLVCIYAVDKASYIRLYGTVYCATLHVRFGVHRQCLRDALCSDCHCLTVRQSDKVVRAQCGRICLSTGWLRRNCKILATVPVFMFNITLKDQSTDASEDEGKLLAAWRNDTFRSRQCYDRRAVSRHFFSYEMCWFKILEPRSSMTITFDISATKTCGVG